MSTYLASHHLKLKTEQQPNRPKQFGKCARKHRVNCLDLCLYILVKHMGVWNTVYNLEPQCVTPSSKFSQRLSVLCTTRCCQRSNKKLSRAVTCDRWTSLVSLSIETPTASYAVENQSLSSHILHTRARHESHTGANVAELLHNVATKWLSPKKMMHSEMALSPSSVMCKPSNSTFNLH